ncbi:hypothetical protein ACFX15_013274 [Malus domestica]
MPILPLAALHSWFLGVQESLIQPEKDEYVRIEAARVEWTLIQETSQPEKDEYARIKAAGAERTLIQETRSILPYHILLSFLVFIQNTEMRYIFALG